MITAQDSLSILTENIVIIKFAHNLI